MKTQISDIRLAVIGCGAVAQQCHLPALRALGIHPALLADKHIDSAKRCAELFEASHYADDYCQYFHLFDAAIVALPNFLHAGVTIDLLNHRVHVLVEKPMAVNSVQCGSMIKASQQNNTALCVGLVRRLFFASQWMKSFLENKSLGEIVSFDFQEGAVFNWPVQSPSFFQPEVSGGGALIDTGAHTLDLLLWWLGEVEQAEYYDDCFGGVEGNCELRLIMKNGATGKVELSRTKHSRNAGIITGTKGQVEIQFYENVLKASPSSLLNFKTKGLRGNKLPKQIISDLFVPEIRNWLDAIHSGSPLFVTPQEAADTVALIERCYGARQPLDLAWL